MFAVRNEGDVDNVMPERLEPGVGEGKRGEREGV